MAGVPESSALLTKWRSAVDIKEQYDALEELFKNNIFPKEDHPSWESEGGLYPDPNMPRPSIERGGEWQRWFEESMQSVPTEDFLPKLMRKREFQESLQPAIHDLSVDKCRATEDFQITPVQRFIQRLLSPRTPYRSALLYHGVGVGKTCASITVAESYLEMYPGQKVCIIAPPNIQEGFRRTIFDIHSLKIGQGTAPNHHNGCTGDIYLSLTNSFNEKNPKVIESRVDKVINSRYEFFGYTSFYNHIKRLIESLEKRKANESLKREVLRNQFSNRIFIIDEAHNLRDNPEETDDDTKDDVNELETAEAKAGKRLTPYLREILSICEGITLVLMTATPMYNSYIEIIFLLNLLLLNDKFATLRIADVFDVRDGSFTETGERILGKVASYYISFMRGENPLSFPLRLDPPIQARVQAWPTRDPKGGAIDDTERVRLVPKAGTDKGGLPCVPCTFTADTEEFYKEEANQIVNHEQGLGIVSMDTLIQGGNWIFPNSGQILKEKIGQRGFDSCFQKEKRGSMITFRPHEGEDAHWLLRSEIQRASGKTAVLLDRLAECKGMSFVYSRFVPSGALTLALALEANGYTAWGRDTGFLATGIQDDLGRQCALCPGRERGHTGHAFKPAKYVLLTGSPELSPNNAASIDACRSTKNLHGEEVKVVLGSQVAGEGLDLRYIREVLVFDSWYHLNKLEQVIGRGIRNCSHALLDKKMRNCTVVLLVNKYESDPSLETVDMYSYRIALEKAIQAGKVLRVLKEHAIDCSLNKDAIVLKGIPTIESLYDSQGVERKDVDINDVPFTVMCDWLDSCDYGCKTGRGGPMPSPPSLDMQDINTYDEYTARYHIHTIRAYIQDLLARGQYYVTFDRLQLQFETIPRTLLLSILNDMVMEDTFRIKTAQGSGRIIFRNGYYIYQPDELMDESIPIAIRVKHVPIPRDAYRPLKHEEEKAVAPSAVGATAYSILAPADDTSEALWEEVKEWTSDMEAGNASIKEVPDQVFDQLRELKVSSGIFEGQKEKFEKILWLYVSIAGKEDMRKKYATVVRKYVWDEYITTAKKRELLAGFSSDPMIQEVASDSYWIFEGSTYLRVLNSETNTLEYLCIDSAGKYTVCTPAIVSVLTRERGRDPLLQRPINTTTTGIQYGFLIFSPKKKALVFKKGKPPAVGGNVQRGAECANNSSTSTEIEALKEYGIILRREGLSDMGLHADELARRKIENSLRVCTVVDLALRMMDALGVQGKRWFYRSIEAHLFNHPLR